MLNDRALGRVEAIRGKLSHPVIDSDGHWKEFPPLLADELLRIGGPVAAKGFQTAVAGMNARSAASAGDRVRRSQPAWWLNAGSTLDRATAVLPKLLFERLDEFGIDFMVLQPSYGLLLMRLDDPAERRAACRAYNIFQAEQFAAFSSRITPAAVVPMHSPEEAIEELEHAAALGLKMATLGSMMRRSDPSALADISTARHAIWHDTLALDSSYDYDPVWRKCLELRMPIAFHTGGLGAGFRVSPTNFVYNHIGQFASMGEAVCKALFLGGVTARFPELRFAFLEGGVGWACTLYRDLINHWTVRNADGLRRTAPDQVDPQAFLALVEEHGGPQWGAYLDRIRTHPALLGPLLTMGHAIAPEHADDFAACRIETAADIRDLFVPPFYFGCEPDDPIGVAFDRKSNPFGARLNALFSSDVSHFDIPDMREVLPEAFEGVEQGVLSDEDFRDFVFANAARFFTHLNRDFFEGTKVAAEVRGLLATQAPSTPMEAVN